MSPRPGHPEDEAPAPSRPELPAALPDPAEPHNPNAHLVTRYPDAPPPPLPVAPPPEPESG